MSKKKKAIRQMIKNINWTLIRLDIKRDWFMYDRPNDEKVDQIDKAMIQIRHYQDILYKQL